LTTGKDKRTPKYYSHSNSKAPGGPAALNERLNSVGKQSGGWVSSEKERDKKSTQEPSLIGYFYCSDKQYDVEINLLI
jgi:hypothetical protein